MRKHLFLFAAGALALTACTSEDVIDDVSTGNVIQFENVVNKMTRAEDLTYSNLGKFNVFGFYTPFDNPNHAHMVFNDVPVTRDANNNWSYTGDPRYWVAKTSYYFYAYSCGNVSKLNTDSFGKFKVDMDDNTSLIGKPASERALEILGYVCDYHHQHDLLYAYYTTTVADNGNNEYGNNGYVSFAFNHALSKVQAKFTNQFSKEYTVIVKNVQIRNVYNKADFSYSNSNLEGEGSKGKWSNPSRPDDVNDVPIVFLQDTKGVGSEIGEDGKPVRKDPELTILSKKLLNSTDEGTSIDPSLTEAMTNYSYVLPVKYRSKDVSLYFEIDVKYGDDYVIQGKPLTASFQPTWNMGYSYIYNIEIGPQALNMSSISFSLDTVQGWSTDDNFTETDSNLTLNK